MVLITGSNLDRRMWAREAGWLASEHTVVRYDLRAHGASDTATIPFRHVDDLFTLLDEIGIQKAPLIGLSAGSVIALDAAPAEPSRVDRLVLVGPGVSGFRSGSQLPFTAALVVTALQARDYVKAGEALLGSSVFAVPRESQALVRQMVMENDRLWSIPREMLRQAERPAIDRLNELKLPTLIMLGELDLFQREEELLARRVGGARRVVIPRGGHLLNLTSPEEFRTEVSQFVR